MPPRHDRHAPLRRGRNPRAGGESNPRADGSGVAAASRLATLLRGRDLAALHARQSAQFRVTVERTHGGELQNPQIEIARPGLPGTVTIDGYLP